MNPYLSVFIDEAGEHLQALNEHMLRLEQRPEDIGIVQVIFRSAHTLKGMSAMMGFEDLASLTHEMENVLDLVRNGKLPMNGGIFDTLFRCLDALESMIRDIVNGGSGGGEVGELVQRLKAIVAWDPGDGPVSSQPDSAALALDEFQQSVLVQSLDAGYRAYFIEVTVREDCMLKAARAYMVFDVLEQQGEVVKAHPSAQDIQHERFDRNFYVYYITQTDGAALHEQIAGVSEIESIRIAVLTPSSFEERKVLHDGGGGPVVQAAAVRGETDAADAAATGSRPVSPAVSRTIRVDIERLDSLMNLFSELLIDRVRLEQLASEIRISDLTETVEHMSRVSADLQNIVLKLRMVPVDSVFNRFPRLVRDLAKSLDKKVDLVITGADTELDRTVIDEIGDPLVHLIRNAIDHGIEPVADRLQSGKSETGTVHLRAYHSGSRVFIEIEEDGRGIHRARALETAVKRGIVSAEAADGLSDEEVNMLLFAAGFSTADKVSDISGRGVGLDVVKSKIASLGGDVTVRSAFGKGTTFSIELPLTLSIISAMLVKLGTEKYAFPLSSIVETAVVKRGSIRTMHGMSVVEYRKAIIPVVSLADIVDSPDYRDHGEAETEMLIVRKGDKLAAVLVDDFIGQSELVLKTVGGYLNNVELVAGATILGDGQVALIIDPNALFK